MCIRCPRRGAWRLERSRPRGRWQRPTLCALGGSLACPASVPCMRRVCDMISKHSPFHLHLSPRDTHVFIQVVRSETTQPPPPRCRTSRCRSPYATVSPAGNAPPRSPRLPSADNVGQSSPTLGPDAPTKGFVLGLVTVVGVMRFFLDRGWSTFTGPPCPWAGAPARTTAVRIIRFCAIRASGGGA